MPLTPLLVCCASTSDCAFLNHNQDHSRSPESAPPTHAHTHSQNLCDYLFNPIYLIKIIVSLILRLVTNYYTLLVTADRVMGSGTIIAFMIGRNCEKGKNVMIVFLPLLRTSQKPSTQRRMMLCGVSRTLETQ